MRGGWRGLGVAWAAVAVVTAGGAGALQWLGPPRAARSEQAASHPAPAEAPVASHAAAPSPAPAPPSPPPAPPAAPPGHGEPTAAAPAPATAAAVLPDPHAASASLPADPRPRLALLLSGLGLSDAESRAAIAALPPGVTLGISPYAPDPAGVAAEAKRRGDEVLVTLPMESQGYPLNDSGPHALMTGAAPEDNARNLEWILGRLPGAAGVTGASDGLHGERFANAPAAFEPVLQEIGTRHMFYVDPRPGAAVAGGAVAVTTVLDNPPSRTDIEARLAELEQRARDGKPALGLADSPRPATVEVLANWARGLAGRGVVLVPVSALLKRSALQ